MAELFQLVYFGIPADLRLHNEYETGLEQTSGAMGLQAKIMEAFDGFQGFSQDEIDQLLRPQLEAAIRHVICRPA